MHRSRLAIAVLVLVAACAGDPAPASVSDVVPADESPASSQVAGIEITHAASFADGATLRVALADDDAERTRGLMHVEGLPPDVGMAFTYDEPTNGAFWMKDTLIPLSIAFVDPGGRVVTILDMQPCQANPCPTYEPGAPYTLAIEANEGWFTDNGIGTGDRVDLVEA